MSVAAAVCAVPAVSSTAGGAPSALQILLEPDPPPGSRWGEECWAKPSTTAEDVIQATLAITGVKRSQLLA